jgi:phosphatidylserine/phosphatidylglycerophosphate/cardiolipin synthase-like enzyme
MPKRKHPSAQDEQKERGSERSAERIRHLSRSSIKGHLRVERLGNTHEKVLIVDKKFALVTSFNFLSFRGDPSRGFRQETGVYHEIPEKVDQLAEQMLGRLERDQLTRSE